MDVLKDLFCGLINVNPSCQFAQATTKGWDVTEVISINGTRRYFTVIVLVENPHKSPYQH